MMPPVPSVQPRQTIPAPHRLLVSSSVRALLAAAALLTFAALLAAGCGGTTTKAEYITQADRIGGDVSRALILLQPSSGHEPTADDLHGAASELDRAARRLGGITPPAEVADAHDRMIKGLKEMSDAFERLADNFGEARTDAQRTQAFLTWTRDPRAQRAFDDLTIARRAFQKAGYDLFPPQTAATTTSTGVATGSTATTTG